MSERTTPAIGRPAMVAAGLLTASFVTTFGLAHDKPPPPLTKNRVERALVEGGLDSRCRWQSQAAFVSVARCSISGKEVFFEFYDARRRLAGAPVVVRSPGTGQCVKGPRWAAVSPDPSILRVAKLVLGGTFVPCYSVKPPTTPFGPMDPRELPLVMH